MKPIQKYSLRTTYIFYVVVLLYSVSLTSCDTSEIKDDQVFLTSWNLEEHEGITFLHMEASNGVEAAIPARQGYGESLQEVVEILKTHNIFDHCALYDSMVAHGISEALLRAADALCWDLHARTLGVPLHEFFSAPI